MAQRQPQDRLNWPKLGPKTAQDGSETATRRPKMAQESPKMAQDSAKMAPRWHQESPKSSQEPKSPEMPLSLQKSLPKSFKFGGQKRPKTRPGARQKSCKIIVFFSEIGSWSVSEASQKWFRKWVRNGRAQHSEDSYAFFE